MSDPEPDPMQPRPMGQLRIEDQKDAFINRAADYGWDVESRDPLRLVKGEKAIEITFNGAGLPNRMAWLVGDEFGSVSGGGYMDLNKLDDWFAWEPDDA